MIFSTSELASIEPGCLAQYRRSVIKNLDVKVDADPKFDSQIKETVKKCFFQLGQLTKMKPILSRDNLETIIHAFITTRLDYCNALNLGVS